jgi:hypothetical protein
MPRFRIARIARVGTRRPHIKPRGDADGQRTHERYPEYDE